MNKSKPRTIYKYRAAEWENIRGEVEKLSQTLITDFDEANIDSNWTSFKHGITEIMDKYIPSKMTTTRYNLPWINSKLKRMIRKKQRLYNKAKKSKRLVDWDRFKSFKKETQKALKTAQLNHLSETLEESLKEKITKPFWSYIKQQRRDTVGVAPLKDKNTPTLVTENKGKAEILNQQFKSVFTRNTFQGELKLKTPQQPTIDDLEIDEDGIKKLLKDVNPMKASGPDNIPNRILKECYIEMSPFLCKLFNSSLNVGQIPRD